jgi:pimeloyl-ACP methyl ester carboxylesterase
MRVFVDQNNISGGKMYSKIFAAFAFFACAVTTQVHADQPDLEVTCGAFEQPVHYEYCVNKVRGSTNPDVVYHLHGAGEDVHAWTANGPGRAVNDSWRTSKTNAPVVVSISFGQAWLLASKNSSPTSGLYDVFVQAVLPNIEANVLHGVKGRRLLFGYSMGGYNGTQLFLKNPELFEKVVLACPALAKVSPFGTPEELEDYIKRTGADRSLVQFMLEIVKHFYPDGPSYLQDAPLEKADKQLGPTFPPLHLSCGDADGFGFYEGATIMRDIAQAHNVNLTWQSLKGPHCVMDPDSIAGFLTK